MLNILTTTTGLIALNYFNTYHKIYLNINLNFTNLETLTFFGTAANIVLHIFENPTTH